MEEWRRYSKIPLVLPLPAASEVRVNDLFVVTEKLHGANFSCVFDGEAVRFAKRSGILAEADDFFSFRSCQLDARLDAQVRRLWTSLARAEEETDPNRDPIVSVTVYGELLGGKYPHSTVPPIPNLLPVQNGVWYSPALHFVAFDVFVVRANGARAFLDFEVARSSCEGAGLMFVAPLLQGRYAACVCEFEIVFESTLPRRLGLPELEPGSPRNLAEGVVVRPLREGRDPELRQLVKRKIPQFSEAQYDNADWKAGRSGRAVIRTMGPEGDALLLFELLANVTQQRLANAVSKHGRVDPACKDSCKELLSMFIADVIDALVEDGMLVSAEALPAALGERLRDEARQLVLVHLREEVRSQRQNVAERPRPPRECGDANDVAAMTTLVDGLHLQRLSTSRRSVAQPVARSLETE